MKKMLLLLLSGLLVTNVSGTDLYALDGGAGAGSQVDAEEAMLAENSDLDLFGAASQFSANQVTISQAAKVQKVMTAQQVQLVANEAARPWKASFNESTGKVRMLYGGISKQYAGNAEGVARGFLADSYELFGLKKGLNDLKMMRADEVDGRSHVRFQQTYNGIPVLGTNLIVHANQNKQVTMVQNGYQETILPANSDVISEGTARETARNDLKASFPGAVKLGAEKFEKQLIRHNNQWLYSWRVAIPTQDPFGFWVYRIDAGTGQVLYKKNEIISFKTGKGSAYKTNADYLIHKVSSVPLQNMFSSTESPSYWNSLFGRYADLYDYSTGSFNSLYGAGNYSYKYDPAVNKNEFDMVQAYYAINTTRSWWDKNIIKKYGPLISADYSNPFNWSTPIVVNVQAMCNAYYTPDITSGDGIPGMVFGDDNSCAYGSADLVDDWDVVRHEYTHAMMDWAGFTTQFGGNVDWYGRAMGEGNADWFAFLQDPKHTTMANVAWAWSTAGYLRNLDNTRMYPRDVDYPGYGPEEHYTGEIWGGYLYDLYKVLGATNAKKFVYNSFFYFDDTNGTMPNEPDFWDAMYAQFVAEYDLTGKYTNSIKALGSAASRGINGYLRATYSSSDYFHTGTANSDSNWFWYYMFPGFKTISTKGNILKSGDLHEYIIYAVNENMNLKATMTSIANAMSNPVIELYNASGTNLMTAAGTATSATLSYSGLASGYYIIRVTGQASTPAHGQYNIKISVL